MSRRVLTWTFGLRTPFNPMSDAATEATRLAPAGRACSKVRLALSLPRKLGGSNACAFGPPDLSNHHQCLHAYCESPEACAFDDSSCRHQILRCSRAVAFRTPDAEMVIFGFWRDRGFGGLRFGLATLLPRLGVTPRGGNAADGRRLTANPRLACSSGLFGWPAGPEFVSEFETKRDQ
jgi:hypothetical protein